MARGRRIAFIVLALVLFLVLAVTSLVGIYVVTPQASVPGGESILYYRRGTGLPMISSADGLNVKYNNGVTLDNRGAMNARIATIIGKKVIAKLPYFPSLYLYSTGNRDFSRLGAGGQAPAPAAPTTPKKP